MYVSQLFKFGGFYGYRRYFNRVVSLGLVSVCCAVFAFSSQVSASAYSPVQGASITPRTTPTASAVGESYRFASNDPRVSFSGAASSYPQPTGTVSKTYAPSAWRPKALTALRVSGASFALYFAADAVCEAVNCVDLVWGGDVELISDVPPIAGGDPGSFPYYDGYGPTEAVIVSGTNPATGWSALSQSDRNSIDNYVSGPPEIGGRPVYRFRAFRAVPFGDPENNLFQQQFRGAYIYTDQTFECPDGSSPSSGSCVADEASETVPFDESLFENAVAQPNVSPEAAELNEALFNELAADSVDGDIEIQFDPVTETVTSTQGNIVTETITQYSYPVTQNNTPSPIVQPTKTETVNTYEDGQLIDSGTVVEEPVSEGGQAAEPLTDCAFFPTLCDFLEWFRVDDPPQDNDFSDLLVDDIEQAEYDFDAGSGECPDPLEINLVFFESSVSLDYQPICDVVGILYYFVVIGASIYSFRIVYGSLA